MSNDLSKYSFADLILHRLSNNTAKSYDDLLCFIQEASESFLSTEGVREKVNRALNALLVSGFIAELPQDATGQQNYCLISKVDLPRRASKDPLCRPSEFDLIVYYLYMNHTARQSQLVDFIEQQLGMFAPNFQDIVRYLGELCTTQVVLLEHGYEQETANPVYRLGFDTQRAIDEGMIILMIPKAWYVKRTVLCDQPLETRYEIEERRDAEVASSLLCESLKDAKEQIHQGEIKDKKLRHRQLHHMFSHYMKEFEHGEYRGMEIRSAAILVSTMTDPSLVLKGQETVFLKANEFLSWKEGVTLADIDEREAQGGIGVRVVHSFISAPRRVEELIGNSGVIGLYGTIYALVVW